MSRLIKTSMSELLSIDNLPTGSVQLLMRHHEMPNKIFAERYWDGKVEKLVYVPEPPTCTMKHDGYYDEQYGIYRCSNCGEWWQFGCDGPKEHHWTCCPKCQARIIEEEHHSAKVVDE